MTRTRYFDYKSSDSSRSLNAWKRGILRSGVYWGYNVVPGSSGLLISIDMDTDPNDASALLGTVISPDGVVIQEDANLTDVAYCSASHATLDRVDYLVADYSYNAGKPNNDVAYNILEGTAGGSEPTLSTSQVLLAKITVPAAATALVADDIVDGAKQELYSRDRNFEDILVPGVYTGFDVFAGSAANLLSLGEGVALTEERYRIDSSATQANLFTLTNNTSADHYRYDVVIALHKASDIEFNPAEYIVVEGVEADESAGAVATIPDDSDILAAATAYDSKFNSLDYVTKLAYVRAKGISTTMVVDVHHYPRLYDRTPFYVSGGTRKAGSPVGFPGPVAQYYPLVGAEGLRSALEFARDLVNVFLAGDTSFFKGSPLKVYVDGDFYFPASTFPAVPSYVEIEGVGSTTFRFPDRATSPIGMLTGFHTTMATPASTYFQVESGGVSQVGVPAGMVRVELLVGLGTDDVNVRGRYNDLANGLEDFLFSGSADDGDPVHVSSDSQEASRGWFESYTTTVVASSQWGFTCILDSVPTVASAYGVNTISIGKRRVGLKNIDLISDNADVTYDATRGVGSTGSLEIVGCEDSEFLKIVATSLATFRNRHCVIKDISTYIGSWYPFSSYAVEDGVSWSYEDDAFGENTYDQLVFRPTVNNAYVGINMAVTTHYAHEYNSIIKSLDYDGGVDNIGYVNLSALTGAKIGQIRVRNVDLSADPIPATTNPQPLAMTDCQHCMVEQFIANDSQADTQADLYIDEVQDSVFLLVEVIGAILELGESGGPNGDVDGNVFVHVAADDIENNGGVSGDTSRRNFVLQEAALGSDEDRNLLVKSNAEFTWSGSTLSWDDAIDIDLPYTGGTLRVATGNASLDSDGKRAYVILDRGETGVAAVSVATVTKTDSWQIRGASVDQALVLAVRFGDRVILADGTTLESGTSGKLGTATPPTGGVSRDKLGSDVQEYNNLAVEPYFYPSTAGLDPATDAEFVQDLSAVTPSYTAATGALDYTGLTVSGVQAGDVYVSANTLRFPILSVAGNTIFIPKNSNPTFGYNTVVRGDLAFYETDAPTSVTRGINNTLTLSYSLTRAERGDVEPGTLFMDGEGEYFTIQSASTSSYVLMVTSKIPQVAIANVPLAFSLFLSTNPRRVHVYDARPTLGWEHVSFCEVGELPTVIVDQVGTPLVLQAREDVYKQIVGADRRFVAKGYVLNAKDDTTRIDQEGIILKEKGSIVITAVMTDLVFLFKNSAVFSETDVSLYVDGVERSIAPTNGAPDFSNISATHQFRGYSCYTWIAPPLMNLTPGVHTIELQIDVATLPMLVGCLVGNSHYGANLEQYEAGGRYLTDGGSYDLADATTELTPASPSTRGGKQLRYFDPSDNTKKWAHRGVPELSVTGDISSASPTVTNIADTTGFTVGNIVALTTSAVTELRVITAVGSTSIDVAPNPSDTQLGATVEYVGHSLAVEADGKLTWPDHAREQIAGVFHVFEGYCYGPGYGSTPTVRRDPVGETGAVARATTFSDAATGITVYSSIGSRTDARRRGYLLSSVSHFVRFSFVGTGLDLLAASTPGVFNVRIDGLDVGDVTCPDLEGTLIPLCHDLSYGSHIVELTYVSGGSITPTAFVVYEPSDPDHAGVSLYSTNYLADIQVHDSFTPDRRVTHKGLVCMDPVQFVSGAGTGLSNLLPTPDPSTTPDPASFNYGRAQEFILSAAGSGYIYLNAPSNYTIVELENTGAQSITIGEPEVLERDGTYTALSSNDSYDAAATTGGLGPFSLVITSGASASLEIDAQNEQPGVMMPIRIPISNIAGSSSNISVKKVHVRPAGHAYVRRVTTTGDGHLAPFTTVKDFRKLRETSVPNKIPPTRKYWDDPVEISPVRYVLRVNSPGAWYRVAFQWNLLTPTATLLTMEVGDWEFDVIREVKCHIMTSDAAVRFGMGQAESVVYLGKGMHMIYLGSEDSHFTDVTELQVLGSAECLGVGSEAAGIGRYASVPMVLPRRIDDEVIG